REAHPRRPQRADTAVIRYRYNMASFSVEDRARPGPSRRSIEISKVSREAFEPVIMAELFPKTAIDIFVEVLQADAGTRTAAINASSIALADAGIPMKGLITSCAFGKVDGQIVLDLNKEEDNYGEADFPVAMTQDGEITLLQMDGHLTSEEIKKGLELVKKGCREILEIQQTVLRKKFETPVEEEPEEKAEEIPIEAVDESEIIEEEPAVDFAVEAALVEKTLEESGELEEVSGEAGDISTPAETLSDSEELEEIIKEAEALPLEEETLEELVEAEIEEEAEEEAFEDEAEFEASFEASFEEVSEPEESELYNEDESEKEAVLCEVVEEEIETESEPDFELAESSDENLQAEETGLEEIIPQETSESEPEPEPEPEPTPETGEVFSEEMIEAMETEETERIEAEEEPQKPEEKEIEAEEAEKTEEISETIEEIEPQEEQKELEEEPEAKSEGPWKVVKDPSESGSRGEN
ncbi:MAG: exosome complex exonuclease Rrp41, partial [Methanosarcina sp.]